MQKQLSRLPSKSVPNFLVMEKPCQLAPRAWKSSFDRGLFCVFVAYSAVAVCHAWKPEPSQVKNFASKNAFIQSVVRPSLIALPIFGCAGTFQLRLLRSGGTKPSFTLSQDCLVPFEPPCFARGVIFVIIRSYKIVSKDLFCDEFLSSEEINATELTKPE